MKKEKTQKSVNQKLNLGFISLDPDNLKENLTEEKVQNLFLIKSYLHVVISEVIKSDKERDDKKALGFLKMAIDETDKFYKGNMDAMLFHEL